MALRDPDRTRESLLKAGFEEIYRNGFRSARLDRILDRTNVTKGAFYHHFPTKRALGEAVIEELIWARVYELWVRPLETSADPARTLIQQVREVVRDSTEDSVACGCPLGNLAQELSPVDDDFRRRIHGVFERWTGTVAEALQRGKRAGRIRAEIDPQETSVFIVASLEGGITMAKQSRERATFEAFAGALCAYLEGLRP